MDSLLQKITRDTESRKEAQEMFRDYADQYDISLDYQKAAREIPLPLVGELQTDPRPRVVRFEDPDHLHIEVWSYGKKKNVYHPDQGETLNFKSRARSKFTIHIRNGLIEYTSTRDTKQHEETNKAHLENTFSFDIDTATDGGIAQEAKPDPLEEKPISSDKIWDVIENIGVFSTLESFQAQNANISYSSVNKRDVKKGTGRDDIKRDTKLRRANVQILVNDPSDKCELIDPAYIFSTYNFDDDDNIQAVKKELKENEDYVELRGITISLHAKNDTILINKANCRPSTRTKVFNHVAEEIGW